jgi:hypothetical protein
MAVFAMGFTGVPVNTASSVDALIYGIEVIGTYAFAVSA